MIYKAVLFDLDGTLLDSVRDLADSMNSALEKYGCPVHGVEAYKYFVGNGMRKLVKRAIPEKLRDDENIEKFLNCMREEYKKRCFDHTVPYDGIPEMLDEFDKRGFIKTILSNKPDEYTKLIVKKLLPDWEFAIVNGAKPDIPIKPDPEGAKRIAEEISVSPEEFVYLGDTSIDMKTAVASGMFPVGVLWGFRGADELKSSGAKILIQKPMELFNYI